MIFDNILNEYYLREADNTGDDNQQQPQNQGTDDDGDEYAMTDPDDAGGDDQGTDDTQTDDTQDTTDDNQEDNTDDNADDDEYAVNDPDEEGTDDTGEDDQNADDNADDDEYAVNDPDEEGTDDDTTDDSGSTDDNDPSAKLKELEKSIFDQLPPEMQTAKSAELKKLYTATYDKCQSIIDIISSADKQPDQIKVYDYVLNSLLDLQKYIKDYLTNIYDSKTYIENMTELQKYLAILDTVNGVFEDMSKQTPADDNK